MGILVGKGHNRNKLAGLPYDVQVVSCLLGGKKMTKEEWYQLNYSGEEQ